MNVSKAEGFGFYEQGVEKQVIRASCISDV